MNKDEGRGRFEPRSSSFKIVNASNNVGFRRPKNQCMQRRFMTVGMATMSGFFLVASASTTTTCNGEGVAEKIEACNSEAQQREKSKLVTVVAATSRFFLAASMTEKKGKSDLATATIDLGWR